MTCHCSDSYFLGSTSNEEKLCEISREQPLRSARQAMNNAYAPLLRLLQRQQQNLFIV